MGTGSERKRSWKRWAAGSAIFVLVLAGAAWYAYTALTDQLVEVLTDEAAQGSNGAESVEGAAEGAPDEARLSDDPQEPASPPPVRHDASVVPPRLPAQAPASKTASADKDKDKSGKLSPKQAPQASVPPAAAASAAKQATVKDRITIGKVLLNHWNAADLKAMSGKLKGGLTIAEKRDLKKEAMAKLTPEEYDKLIAIAQKLGLSRGKNYADSVREQQSNP